MKSTEKLAVETLEERMNMSTLEGLAGPPGAFSRLKSGGYSPVLDQQNQLPSRIISLTLTTTLTSEEKTPESTPTWLPGPIEQTEATIPVEPDTITPTVRRRPTIQTFQTAEPSASLTSAMTVGPVITTAPTTTPNTATPTTATSQSGPTGIPATQTARYQLAGPVRARSWTTAPAGSTNVTGFVWVTNTSPTASVAAESRTKPAGMASLFLWDMAGTLFSSNADNLRDADGNLTAAKGPWLDNGVAATTRKAEAFFSAFKALGGRLDYLVLDFEKPFDIWSLSPDQIKYLPTDPRGAALIKAIGAPDAATAWDSTTPGSSYYLKWNAAVADLTNRAIDKAIFDVAKKYFPSARMSNYESFAMSADNLVPDPNGVKSTYGSHTGTTNAPVLYGYIRGLATVKMDGTTEYGKNPFTVLRYETNKLRSIVKSSPDDVTPWISYKGFESNIYRGNDYYQEQIFHAALSGANDFLLWNPQKFDATQNAADWSDDTQTQLVDQTLGELNAKLGTAVRTVITPEAMSWNSSLVVSGAQIGQEKVLWRVTAPEGTQRIRVQETGEVFNLNGVGMWYESLPGVKVTFLPG